MSEERARGWGSGREGAGLRRQAKAGESPSWGRKPHSIYYVSGLGLGLGCKDG